MNSAPPGDPGTCTKGHPRIWGRNGRPRCQVCGKASSAARYARIKHTETYRTTTRKAQKAKRARVRLEAIELLGGRCACCGQDRPAFLQIDHINGDGAQHRAQMKRGSQIQFWVVRNPGLARQRCQVLCANCNMAKETEENHTCPRTPR